MRKYFTTLLLVLFTLTVFGQQQDSTLVRNAADYLKKSKRQKTTGWVLTSVGTTGLLVTLIADASQALGGAIITVGSLGSVEPEYKSYTTYYLLSTAAVAGGILSFISAGNNKKIGRAMQTTFKMESAPVLLTNGIGQQSYPSLSFFVQL